MKRLFYIVMLMVLLFGCGVKKDVVVEKQGADTKVLAQRAKTDELARQNTIQIDDFSREWMKHYSGHYVLDYQNNIHGQKMPGDSITADSLVLTENGYYYIYKKGTLVEYGRFNIKNHVNFKYCTEQYKLDMIKGELTNEIERIEQEMNNPDAFVMDWFSYYRDYHRYWVVYRHNENTNKNELEILLDIYNDCIRLHWPGSNFIKWIER